MKSTETSRDDNTRRLSCYRKVVVKKDWKTTTVLLLPDCATHIEESSSPSLPRFFCSRIVFLCYHPCLVSVLFTGPSLLVVNLYRKFFTPSSNVKNNPRVLFILLTVEKIECEIFNFLLFPQAYLKTCMMYANDLHTKQLLYYQSLPFFGWSCV